MIINHTEALRCPYNKPSDPYGPPTIRWIVRVYNATTRRWWYVKQFRSGIPVWTSDPTYAKPYSECRSSVIQAELLGLPVPGAH